MSVVTRAAQADFLRDLVRDECTMRLYVNDLDPSKEPTAADFVEVEGGGYRPKAVREAGWDMTDAPDGATYPKQTWVFEGPVGIVRGYYVIRKSDGRLRWYDPLSGGPMRIVNPGDEISVTAVLGLGEKPAEPAEEIVVEQEQA